MIFKLDFSLQSPKDAREEAFDQSNDVDDDDDDDDDGRMNQPRQN